MHGGELASLVLLSVTSHATDARSSPPHCLLYRYIPEESRAGVGKSLVSIQTEEEAMQARGAGGIVRLLQLHLPLGMWGCRH